MKRSTRDKLTLNKERLRVLDAAELSNAVSAGPDLSKLACTNTCYSCDIATVSPKAKS